MKYEKLFNEILKKYNKVIFKDVRDANEVFKIAYKNKDDVWFLSLDGYRGYYVEDSKIPFNIDKMHRFEGQGNSFFVKKEDYKKAVRTNEIKQLDKVQVVKIENENGHSWYNVKFLEYFESDAEYFISDKKNSMLYVYENESLVGFVCPVNVKED